MISLRTYYGRSWYPLIPLISICWKGIALISFWQISRNLLNSNRILWGLTRCQWILKWGICWVWRLQITIRLAGKWSKSWQKGNQSPRIYTTRRRINSFGHLIVWGDTMKKYQKSKWNSMSPTSYRNWMTLFAKLPSIVAFHLQRVERIILLTRHF